MSLSQVVYGSVVAYPDRIKFDIPKHSERECNQFALFADYFPTKQGMVLIFGAGMLFKQPLHAYWFILVALPIVINSTVGNSP